MKKHILEAQIAENATDGGAPPIAATLTQEAYKDHWIMANPIHALHMASQLEPDGATVILPKEQPLGEPALYGEEQLRSKAIVTNGISPAVEFIPEAEEHEHEYATRTTVPPPPSHHHPQGSVSAYGTVPPKQQPPITNTSSGTSSSTFSGQGTLRNVTMMPPQPQPPAANASAMFPRRPAIPSGIVPPSSITHMAPPPTAAQAQQANFMPPPIAGQPQRPNFMHLPHNVAGTNPPSKLTQPRSVPQNMAFAPPNTMQSRPSNSSSSSSTASPARSSTRSSVVVPKFLLEEERFEELRRKEQALLVQRHVGAARRKLTAAAKKKQKRQKVISHEPVPLLPNGLFTKTMYKLDSLAKWQEDAKLARATVEEWMERFRLNRYAYWQEQEHLHHGEVRECQQCNENGGEYDSCDAVGDELMQCLECSFVGCGPQSLLEESNHAMMHHMLRTGHSLAVTCGELAEVFCFKCGDFVYHQVFDQERERIDISKKLPWMGWHDGPVQRSFDAFQFLNTTEHGVVWRGMIASYPPLVPQELVQAGRLTMRRLLVKRGDLCSPSSLSWGSRALGYAVYQNENVLDNSRMILPVGMYNLGNTCFMTCILQCLIHCVPLQRHFLQDVGHHHKSCELVRSAYRPNDSTGSDQQSSTKQADEFNKSNICLACEMDKLFLQYFGSSVGQDVTRAVCQEPHPLDRYEHLSSIVSTRGTFSGPNENGNDCVKGEPLVTTKLLAAAWKSGGMDHLAGYEQGDAHEFLQAFLDTVGKHDGEYRKLLRFMKKMALPSTVAPGTNATSSQDTDIIKRLFEGTLRSVLICDECGCKRKMPETFLNVSLPLSKHVQDRNASGARGTKMNMSIERCLEQFTSPESLADPVECPQCIKKTPTKKQHTFAKLPKVLCLHLKRFDAAKNRKIEDFVSFPAHGLDMGQFLPHWREAGLGESKMDDDNGTSPEVLYDLFATANHTGTLHQGHYVANVKAGGEWFHCNDAHVSKYNKNGVLCSDGAYVLFYIRRSL